MKITYLILIALLFITTACTKDESDKEKDLILGSWELKEIYSNDGSANNGEWQPPNTIYKYTFLDDNTFTSTRFLECVYGTYTFTEDTIELNFGCENFTTGIENPPGVFKENYTFENNHLILVPTYLSCDEGCGWKFKRIQSE